MNTIDQEQQNAKMVRYGGGSDAVYAIGMVGAWVYYFKRAATTQERILAFLKGLVWPAYMVYQLFVFLEKEQGEK